jgi:hypothetical protein
MGDSIKFMESEVREGMGSRPGNLGMSLLVNPDVAVAILQSFIGALDYGDRVAGCGGARRVPQRRGSDPSRLRGGDELRDPRGWGVQPGLQFRTEAVTGAQRS